MPLLTVTPQPTSSIANLIQKKAENDSTCFLKNVKTIKNVSNLRVSRLDHFIIRDFDSENGFSIRGFQNGQLPRSQKESYVPYGITSNDSVVYAKTGEHQGFNHSVVGLKPYTTEISQERRSLAASELGAITLHNKPFTEKAVDKISKGIYQYLQGHFEKAPEKTLTTVAKEIGHYFFTGGTLSFGRISEQQKNTLSDQYIWNSILNALEHGTLDQKMAIHDAIGRKVLPKLGGEQQARYEAIGKIVRQDWFDQKDIRGRINRKNNNQPSYTAGIANDKHAHLVGKFEQPRTRAVDIFERDLNRLSHPQANSFFDDIDSHNLLFGAGISGTTGTLLQAAEAFGPLRDMEEKKQYMLAIVAYLVGGGMHSYHETMVVGQKIGIPYKLGSYVESLPDSFKASKEFHQWNQRYYDISVLGATHWRFNAGKLPSHLELQK